MSKEMEGMGKEGGVRGEGVGGGASLKEAERRE